MIVSIERLKLYYIFFYFNLEYVVNDLILKPLVKFELF